MKNFFINIGNFFKNLFKKKEIPLKEDGSCYTKEELKELKKKNRQEKKEAKKQEIAQKKAIEKQKADHYLEVCRAQSEALHNGDFTPNEEAFISLQHINKIYPNKTQAVFDFNLDIKKHEFIVFVGPSGCGKSTTLRMIAGLEQITSGALFIDGKFSNLLEPGERELAMVFQSYALYPHMTVYNNLAFSLREHHVPKDEIEKRVKRVCKILELDQYLDRKPGNLSGGQCQRVALGRAIIRNTGIFLMDEPLSNLDAKLRVQMRSEIVNLHRELNATTIYVTHDQTEAMTMATRIVVMKGGYVQQIGEPKEIYNHPANVFVATFIGSPAMNICNAHLNKGVIAFNEEHKYKLPKALNEAVAKYYKEKEKPLDDIDVIFGVRPEDIMIYNGEGKSYLEIKLDFVELLGNEYHLHSKIGDQKIVLKAPARTEYSIGETIKVKFDDERVHIFDKETTECIL